MKKAPFVWSCCAALLLTACSESEPNPGNPDGGGNPAPNTITVTGKVVDVSGQPATNVSVFIPGDGRQAATVDSSGTFSISGVTVPYDVIVAQRDIRTASVYKGLSRQNLTLPIIGDEAVESEYTATVEGTVSGGRTPYESNDLPRVEFSSTASGRGTQVDASGGYSAGVSWSGPASITGTLYAIQAESDDFLEPPSSYLGFGRRDNVTLGDNTTLSAQDITMSSVTNSTLAGNLTVPNGYSPALLFVSLVPEPNANISLFSAVPSGNEFSYVVPQIPQATFTMQATASVANPGNPFNTASSMLFKRGLTAGTQNAALVLQEAPRPQQPADNATDVTRTTAFSWTAFTGGLHQLILRENADRAPYTVHIYTSGTQTTLPDLSALDMALPASKPFTWRVQGVAPVASMDALLDLTGKGNPFLGSEDFAISTSETRTLTTAGTP